MQNTMMYDQMIQIAYRGKRSQTNKEISSSLATVFSFRRLKTEALCNHIGLTKEFVPAICNYTITPA